MANKKESGKTTEVLKGFVKKASDVGKKAVDGAQKGVKIWRRKIKTKLFCGK